MAVNTLIHKLFRVMTMNIQTYIIFRFMATNIYTYIHTYNDTNTQII